MKTCLFLIALGLSSATAASAPTPRDATAALTALQMQDLRVASIAHRLATQGAPLCRTVDSSPGFLVQDLAEFSVGVRPMAAALFHLGRGPAVEAIIPDGPAARAGIAAKDEILGINGAVPADLAAAKDRSGWFGAATRAAVQIGSGRDGYGLGWWTYPTGRFARMVSSGRAFWSTRHIAS